jgi:hypothetical protein
LTAIDFAYMVDIPRAASVRQAILRSLAPKGARFNLATARLVTEARRKPKLKILVCARSRPIVRFTPLVGSTKAPSPRFYRLSKRWNELQNVLLISSSQ